MIKKIITGLIIFGMSVFILRFIMSGPEDNWICVRGEWVKHGNPDFPKPTGGCYKQD